MIQISIGWCSQLQGAKTSPFSRFFCFFLSLDALVCWLLRFSRSFWSQSCVCLMKKKLSLFFENIHTLWSLCIIISVNTKYSMIAIHSVRSLAIQLNMFVKYHSIRILCVHRTKQLKSDTCDTTLPGKGWGGTQLVFFHKWSYYCKCLNLFFFRCWIFSGGADTTCQLHSIAIFVWNPQMTFWVQGFLLIHRVISFSSFPYSISALQRSIMLHLNS